MGSDLLRRVRWSNVARVVAAVAVVAAIVAWPRLGPPRPRVPDRAARPLVTAASPTPTVVPPVAVVPTPTPTPRREARRLGRAERRRAPKPWRRARRARLTNPGIEEGGATGPVVGGATSAPVREGAASAPAPAASTTPARDPTQTEFGFER